jgi:uncharacterized membrane protein YphA (DoxX/SURF4 family)
MLSGLFVARTLLGAVFCVSGALKLSHWSEFHDTFSAMELFPRWFTYFVSRVLPPLECFLGISVVIAWKPALTGRLLLLLILSFLTALALYRLRGGKRLVCGCFGNFYTATSAWSLIVRNVMLLTAAILVGVTRNPLADATGRDWFFVSLTVCGLMLCWNLISRLADTIHLIRDYAFEER